MNGMRLWLSSWMCVWTISDMRHRSILMWQVCIVFLSGILGQWINSRLLTWEIAGGVCMGLILWGISGISGERIGKGDALVLMCIGLYEGVSVTLTILMLALFLSSIVSVYLLWGRRWSSKAAIPFVPFLLVSMVVTLLLTSCGVEGSML